MKNFLAKLTNVFAFSGKYLVIMGKPGRGQSYGKKDFHLFFLKNKI